MKILIVEDDRERALMLKKYLQSNSVEVLLADDGMEAIRLLKLESVDLVLSDVTLPYMSGFDLAKKIKSSEKLKPTPFFMYSSRRMTDSIKNLAREMGADRCIVNTDIDEIGYEALAYYKTL